MGIISFLLLCRSTAATPQFDFYVGRGQQFATLEESRDAMREQDYRQLHNGTAINVFLAPGTHYVGQTFALDGRDEVVGSTPVVYQSLDPAKPAKLTGGLDIPVSEFQPVGGMPGVVRCDLFALGRKLGKNISVESFGNGKFGASGNRMELFLNGVPQILARDPNLLRDGTSDIYVFAGYENATNISDTRAETSIDFQDASRGALWQRALREGPLHLHGYWHFDWAQNFVTVKDIVPLEESRQGEPASYKILLDTVTGEEPSFGLAPNCRFYAVDSLALLDSPSEYFINTTTGNLFFMPPNEGRVLQPSDVVTISLSDAMPLISVAGTRSPKQFKDLEVSVSRGSLASFSNVSNIMLGPGLIFSNAYSTCVSVASNGAVDASGEEIVGSNITVVNNVFQHCGGTGIDVSGGGVKKLEPANITIQGNLIDNMGRIVRTYQPGVGWAGVGITVKNNTITNGPHSAINGHGYLSLFEDNHIENVTTETTDSSAFYTGFSWTQRGNTARRNMFRNIRNNTRLAFYQGLWNSAIYLDEEIGGWTLENNTVINAAAGVFINGGRDNIVRRNYFESGDVDIIINPWGTFSKPGDTAEPCHFNCNHTETAPIFPPRNWMCFRKELIAVGAFDEKLNATVTSSLFVKTFPALANIYNHRPCFPVGNKFQENRFCHSGNIAHPGGKFLSQTQSAIESWDSLVENNLEHCNRQPNTPGLLSTRI